LLSEGSCAGRARPFAGRERCKVARLCALDARRAGSRALLRSWFRQSGHSSAAAGLPPSTRRAAKRPAQRRRARFTSPSAAPPCARARPRAPSSRGRAQSP
jgi:hypothetical protein